MNFRVIDDQGTVVLNSQGGTVQNLMDFTIIAPPNGVRTYTLQAQVLIDPSATGTPQMFRRALGALVLKR
jgi:hypothetical protein